MFCSDPVPDGPWPKIARRCLAPRAAGCFPQPTRSGPFALQVAPLLPEPAQSSSSIFRFSEISANMQNLLNPYLSNGNSKQKVFYMKVY
jgi:hypothetical protein